MATLVPPGTPTVNLPPVRSPIPVRDKAAYITDSHDWTKHFALLFNALIYLLESPVLLSGLDGSKPNPTVYPQNTRYFATDSVKEYTVIYATPGNPATASWVQIP